MEYSNLAITTDGMDACTCILPNAAGSDGNAVSPAGTSLIESMYETTSTYSDLGLVSASERRAPAGIPGGGPYPTVAPVGKKHSNVDGKTVSTTTHLGCHMTSWLAALLATRLSVVTSSLAIDPSMKSSYSECSAVLSLKKHLCSSRSALCRVALPRYMIDSASTSIRFSNKEI